MRHHLIAASLFALLAACASTPTEPAALPASATAAEVSAPGGLPVLTPISPMPSAPLDRSAALTRISVGSCMKQEDDQSIWTQIAAGAPQLFLFIGDNVYGDVYSGDPLMPELRDAYARLAQSAPFKAFRERVPVMPIWDDHDYGLNDAGATFPLRFGGEALFEEAWALPANDPRRARPGVYHTEIVGPPGQRVQIILLDTRFFRSDLKATDEKNAPGKERYLPDSDPSKTMLGDAQYAWLAAELEKPAEVRLIVSSIQVLAEGHGWEAWRTLSADRQRFYDTLAASGADGIVLLSGDRHSGALYRNDRALPYPLYELTTSSLNAPASVWRAKSGETRVEEDPARLGDMYYDVNYGEVGIDWTKGVVSLTLRGGAGDVLTAKELALKDLRYGE